MRSCAIDLGTRRVGLAMSDAGGGLATPFRVLQIQSSADAIEPISRIIQNEGVEQLVVGFPLNMDDTIGEKARAAVQFARQLQKRFSLPVVLVDERLSTFAAEQDLIQSKKIGRKITRKKKTSILDALAAAQFLQAFLDGKLAGISPQDVNV